MLFLWILEYSFEIFAEDRFLLRSFQKLKNNLFCPVTVRWGGGGVCRSGVQGSKDLCAIFGTQGT